MDSAASVGCTNFFLVMSVAQEEFLALTHYKVFLIHVGKSDCQGLLRISGSGSVLNYVLDWK